MIIPVRCPYIRRRDMHSVLSCMVEDPPEPGAFFSRFLRAAKELIGFEQGVAFRSPAAALGAALDCIALPEGASVALSALSPAYYAQVLKERRLAPVWMDVHPDSGCPDQVSLNKARSASRALLLYEGAGIFPNPSEYADLGIPVIEDITESLGASIGEAKAGSLGTLTLLSMEPSGLLTAGGGALLFANGRREAQALKNLAESLLPEYMLTDLNAALGLSQILALNQAFERRRELARLFQDALSRSRHQSLRLPGEGEPAWPGLPVVLSEGVQEVRAYARKKDVDTALAFEYSCTARGIVPVGACPHAASLSPRCLLFPLHPRIGKVAAQKVSRVLATLP
ncbi:MAG TPA: DegT/DnrJ/EryC1/StrS family aminotransferase [Magnetospirillaceae bacterium]|nr:DegT/DnrJ/EryC1/StrS family aminotransferase [Magnetospirillaceae bacterium]